MVRRVAVAVLAPPPWHPSGVDPRRWREALVEDVLDVLATLAQVEVAVAVADGSRGGAVADGSRGGAVADGSRGGAVADGSRDLLARVGWPGLRSYAVPSLDVATVLAAAAADGFDQAVVLPADVPDLPAMLIAKLLRPLTTRPAASAPAVGATMGLLGVAARLPAPEWMPAATLDDLTAQSLRRLAPQQADVAPAPGWHRLRSLEDLARLDIRLEGWDATRALLLANAALPSATPPSAVPPSTVPPSTVPPHRSSQRRS